MVLGLRDALGRADRRAITDTKRLDDVLDKLNAAIKAYLTALGSGKKLVSLLWSEDQAQGWTAPTAGDPESWLIFGVPQ